jgi:hypothetical protein
LDLKRIMRKRIIWNLDSRITLKNERNEVVNSRTVAVVLFSGDLM